MKDFYYILGTSSDATAPEIEAAYQKLAHKFYDEQDEFMDAHFREIAEAYDTLRDSRRRKKYDAALRSSQKKQIAVFRLKYLNTAVTITFLAVTALFGFYVIQTIRGHEAKKTMPAVTPQVLKAASPVHLKNHRKTTPVAQPVQNDSVTKKAIAAALRTSGVTDMSKQLGFATADSSYTAILHANITGIVYLHQSADYNSPVMAKLPGGVEVRVLQTGQVYCKISYAGQEGYVFKTTVVKN
ncbi:MAG TPA: DnaJ domain-containing protein [Mucilaginibacter sp.]|nr:DnaJ domain-containing protein [Mucilaginibacter sp.]